MAKNKGPGAEMRRLMARGTPPEKCGPAMPVAPARGPVRPFMPASVMVDAKGEEKRLETGYRGRHAARVRDVFEKLGHRLTPGQVATGRKYAALVEAIEASGTGTVRLDGVGGCGRDDVAERVCQMRRDLDAMRRRIGDEEALTIRRVRPSKRGGRRAVTLRELVDQVCCGDRTPLQVLLAAGWARDAERVRELTVALGEALDRMAGYAPRSWPRHKV